MAYIIYNNLADAQLDSHNKMKTLGHWGCCQINKCTANCPKTDNVTAYWWEILTGTQGRYAVNIGSDTAPNGRTPVDQLPNGFLPSYTA